MKDKKSGIGKRGMERWLLLFTVLWTLGRVLTRGCLHGAKGESLQQILASSPNMMYVTGIILVLEALSTCGILLASAMIIEELRYPEGVRKNMLWLGALALVSEIPYDLMMYGRAFDMELQNPAFGVLISALVICYWDFGKGAGKTLVRMAVLLAALAWCSLLRVEFGVPMLVITLILWLFRNQPEKRGFVGMLAAAVCILISPYFLAAPMGAVILHFYNGEKTEERGWFYALSYQALLLLGWILICLL